MTCTEAERPLKHVAKVDFDLYCVKHFIRLNTVLILFWRFLGLADRVLLDEVFFCIYF